MTVTIAEPDGWKAGSGRVGWVIAPRDDYELFGASEAVRRVIDRRKTAFGAIGTLGADAMMFIMFVSVVIGSALLGIIEVMNGSSDTDTWGSSGAYGIGLALTVIGLLIWARTGRNSWPAGIVVLAYKEEAPSFWAQHRAAIILNLATNAFVGAAFYLLGLWQGG